MRTLTSDEREHVETDEKTEDGEGTADDGDPGQDLIEDFLLREKKLIHLRFLCIGLLYLISYMEKLYVQQPTIQFLSSPYWCVFEKFAYERSSAYAHIFCLFIQQK